MADILVFDSIHKHFGTTRAVDGVTLSIAKGETFSLLGPSGCGKTTLLRVVAGLEPPTAGAVTIDGSSPASEQQRNNEEGEEERTLWFDWSNVLGEGGRR